MVTDQQCRTQGPASVSGSPSLFSRRCNGGIPKGLRHRMAIELSAYFGLFSVAFLAATLLPAHSEVGLAGLILSGDYAIPLLILVASVGNTLGSVVNWFLGRGIEHFRDRKWFPASPRQIEKATRWYHQYGRWSLLLSWMPFLGDPLTLAAGVLREPLPSFIAIVAVAKTARYLVVTAITLSWV